MDRLPFVLIAFVPLLFSLSFHEAAHAWMANRLGDPTAKFMGRLTLNPLPHIDPVGTLVLPLVAIFMGGGIFGWAKPVPVNERNLRNRHRDGLLVAAAGPVSNLVLAVGFTFLLAVLLRAGAVSGGAEVVAASGVMRPIEMMVDAGIQLNIILAVFNLLPVPPLDGSRVLAGLIPAAAPQLAILERYGFLVLFLLLFTKVLNFIVFLPSSMIYSYLLSWVT